MFAYIVVFDDLTILFKNGFDSAFEAECAELDLHKDHSVLNSKIVEI